MTHPGRHRVKVSARPLPMHVRNPGTLTVGRSGQKWPGSRWVGHAALPIRVSLPRLEAPCTSGSVGRSCYELSLRGSSVQGMLGHLRPQMLCACRKVDGGGFDILVPHHAREAVNIAAAFEHQRRKRVTKLMHGERQVGALPEDENDMPQPIVSESDVRLVLREELRTRLVRLEMRCTIRRQNLPQCFRHRHDPVFPSLASPDEEREICKVHIGNSEVQRLTLAQPSKEKCRDDPVVPVPYKRISPRVVLRDLQQAHRFLQSQPRRYAPLGLRHRKVHERISIYPPVLTAPPKEDFEGFVIRAECRNTPVSIRPAAEKPLADDWCVDIFDLENTHLPAE